MITSTPDARLCAEIEDGYLVATITRERGYRPRAPCRRRRVDTNRYTFTSGVYGTNRPQQLVNVEGRHPTNFYVDEDVAVLLGSDARYMVCHKASRTERDVGLSLDVGITRNPHTCVKPRALMAWLARLLCPVDGTVLDPFAGSGSTGIGALDEGRSFLGIEREDIYAETARLRLSHTIEEGCR